MKAPTIRDRDAPTMRVMAGYSMLELLDALLDVYEEMPNEPDWDFDNEGHDEYERIYVPRVALREACRRLAEQDP